MTIKKKEKLNELIMQSDLLHVVMWKLLNAGLILMCLSHREPLGVSVFLTRGKY